MTQFVLLVALSKVHSSKISRAQMENVLLKFELYLCVIIDDAGAFTRVFLAMIKYLNIRSFSGKT